MYSKYVGEYVGRLAFIRVVAKKFKQAGHLWTDLEFDADFKSGFIVFVSLSSSSGTTLKDFGLPLHFELKKPSRSVEILS